MFQSTDLTGLSVEELVARGLTQLAITKLEGDLSASGRHAQRLAFLNRRLNHLDGKTCVTTTRGSFTTTPGGELERLLRERERVNASRDRDQQLLDELAQ